MKYNLLSKRHHEKSYLLYDFMATKLSKTQFEKLKALNPQILGEYYFIPQNETDFSWWHKCTKYLTNRKISQAYFDIDYYGNITKY